MTNEPLNTELDDLRRRLDRAEARQCRAERRVRLSWFCALAALGVTLVLNVRPAALAQSPGVNLASLVARITALETKTAALTQTGTPGTSGALLTVKGDNVQIVDGSGSTSDGTLDEFGYPNGKSPIGLGNLIIGYNATGNYNGDMRTGSHNLILGDGNNYSSFGGLVAGQKNTISNAYASVTSGFDNTASGQDASVTGGLGNTASGFQDSVSGGFGNTASGVRDSVSGGESNTASGAYASVSGGYANTASAESATVSGGDTNTASAESATVSGGEGNTASAEGATVSGGGDNTVSGGFSSVSGGYANTVSGVNTSVSGGGNISDSTNEGWAGGNYHTP